MLLRYIIESLINKKKTSLIQETSRLTVIAIKKQSCLKVYFKFFFTKKAI